MGQQFEDLMEISLSVALSGSFEAPTLLLASKWFATQLKKQKRQYCKGVKRVSNAGKGEGR
jgi:hypothetical protein